jgi:putative membrane protein insertion efficiency factor
MSRVLIAMLSAYRRWISPMLRPHCRFTPSCSAYAIEAISTHGAVRGTGLTLRRLAKCQPFFTGGYDPVPPLRPSRLAHPRGIAR